ncbi:MAG TPA: sensor histidine kinase [Acidimicrobiia bacterium]
MTRSLPRLEQAPPWAVDAVLGTLIVLVGLLTTGGKRGADPNYVYKDRDAIAFALILGGTLPYYLRRRAPATVFLATTAAIGTLMVRGYDEGALPFVLLVGAYTVGAYRPAREVIATAGVMVALLFGIVIGDAPGFGAGQLLTSVAAFGTAMFVGWTMQARRQRIDTFPDEQADAALRAAADERLRIAQELHDVVAHSLGVIAVQAGVGMHVLDSDREEARRSLENISRTSRASLAEIRWLLGLVRNAEGMPAYTPAPGLADLPRLAQEVTSAGLAVDVQVAGGVEDLPTGVGLAAYRIVQEALTNALRHARAQRATVRLDNASGVLLIEVADDGRGPNGARSGGHGLVGMRERVAVYGGSLDTGPGAQGGFRVVAQLPYDVEPVA